MASDTRSKILDYLRKNKAATAGELGLKLQLTGADIRHHLAYLKKEGRIVVLGQRREGKGRPIFVFGASDQVLGTGMKPLAEALLESWIENVPPFQHEIQLEILARHLIKEPVTAVGSAPRRLGQLVERLNAYHYEAHWEAGAMGPQVILGHCPYAEMIERHPELCHMDAFLLAAQSGMQARQVSKLEQGRDGARRCIFAIE